jgi:hypothetical protein
MMELAGGWKTYSAGILSILWGAAGLYLGMHGPDAAITFVASGLAVVGFRHKLESIGLPKEILERLDLALAEKKKE